MARRSGNLLDSTTRSRLLLGLGTASILVAVAALIITGRDLDGGAGGLTQNGELSATGDERSESGADSQDDGQTADGSDGTQASPDSSIASDRGPEDGDDESEPADSDDGAGSEHDHEHGPPGVPALEETTPTGPVSPLGSALAPSTTDGTASADPDTSSSSTNADGSPAAPSAAGGVWQPKPGISWQWQLTGAVDTTLDVEVYNIDLFDTPQEVIDEIHAGGGMVICYFSAGAWEDWRPDAGSVDGSMLGRDNGWPGEKWLDISRLEDLGPFIEQRLDLAVQKQCDAVEPDNVDGYQNDTDFDLTPSDQIVFNSFVANQAHQRGLSVGLKNAAELVGVLEPLFDWALVEECVRYDECGSYSPFVSAGKAVFHVEYQGDLDYCAYTAGLQFSSLEKDLDVGPGYRPCP